MQPTEQGRPGHGTGADKQPAQPTGLRWGGLGRRRFLEGGAGAFLAAGSTVGCDALSTSPSGDEGTEGKNAKKGAEAPMLAKLVKSGDLPPVEERLPTEPLVVEPVDRIGVYGGEWRFLSPGPSTDYPQLITMGYENLVRWLPDNTAYSLDDIIANIAESFDFDEAGVEYTFVLREGMRWSDGKPFGVDDIVFWYEHVLLDPELTPSMPTWLGSGDQPVTVQKLDDLTVRFTFAEPNGLFLHNLAAPTGDSVTHFPAHYVQQFHKSFNDAVEQDAKAAGFSSWVDYFSHQASWFENAERPVLFGWQLTKAPGEGTQRVVAERNPYYWKVDPDGSQLPYLDQISYTMAEEIETMVLRASGGEVDMQNWLLARHQDKPVYSDNREPGDYRFYKTISAEMNVLLIGLNMAHKDPVKREVFSSRDFRIGLSHAINRQEIIDVVYQHQGEPWQGAPRPESPFHNEELAKQYTEFDLDLANEHLDRTGFNELDTDGMRLGPDRKPIRFSVDVITDEVAAIDALELIGGYWKEVGVAMEVRTSERSLWTARKDANDHDAAVWIGDGGLDLIVLPRWYAPLDTWGSLYGLPWAFWYVSGGTDGEEPPEPAKQQAELYDGIRATADPDEQVTLMKELLEISREEFWAIGIALTPEGYGIVKNNFHNVPDTIQQGWTYPNQAPTNPEQYFIE